MLETVALMVVAFIFAYMYINEDEKNNFLLKWVWLFCAISVLVFGLFDNYQLSSTVTNTLTNTVVYNYAPTNYLNPFATGLGILLIFLIVYFVWRLVRILRGVIR